MEQHLQAIATVISLMNPVMCASFFSRATPGFSKEDKMKSAIKAMTAISTVLILSALFGTRILKMFGVSLDAFAAAGGVVLIWMGFSMLQPKKSSTLKEESPSLAPLVLFAASPGTITGVITLAVAQTGSQIPISALIAVGVTCLITLMVLILSIKTSGKTASDSLFRQTTTSFMGLIVLSMGFQFALTGIKNFFA